MNARTITMRGQFAVGAQTEIPKRPFTGTPYRDTGLDPSDIEKGQQYGSVYDSARYNQILYEATGMIRETEQYGIPRWSPLTDYPVSGLALGTDGDIYQALLPSGQGVLNVGPKDPAVAGNVGVFWQKAIEDDNALKGRVTGLEGRVTTLEGGKVDISEYSQIPFKRVWVSGQYTPSRGTPIIATHNLNIANPLRALGVVNLVCLVAEGGYAVGDIASASARFTAGSGSGLTGTAVATLTANTIEVTPGASANNGFTLSRKDTGAYLDCTAGRWAVVFRVYY